MNLKRLGINPESIDGYQDEKMTHSEVALAVAQGLADTGLGVQTAALCLWVGFCLPDHRALRPGHPRREVGSARPPGLARWLSTAQAKSAIANLGAMM